MSFSLKLFITLSLPLYLIHIASSSPSSSAGLCARPATVARSVACTAAVGSASPCHPVLCRTQTAEVTLSKRNAETVVRDL